MPGGQVPLMTPLRHDHEHTASSGIWTSRRSRSASRDAPSTNGWPAPWGPTVWVGVMYVYKSGQTSPANDHLHGYGSVAPDPHSPNVYVAMWSTT